MRQRHRFPGQYRKGTYTLCISVCLASTLLGSLQGTYAADITEQLTFPANTTLKEARDEADRLVRLGGQQEQQGELDKAVESWSQALALYETIDDRKGQGITHEFLGLTYAQLGRYNQAEDALRRRLAIARDTQDFQGQIFGLNNLGTILLRRGAVSAAQGTFEQALQIARSVNNIAGQGLSLSNLGLTAAGQRDHYQAIKRYETALTFRRQTGDPLGEASTLNNLGDAHLATNNYEETIASYGAALRLARVSHDRPNQLRAIDGLVTAHSNVGRYDRAFELLQQRLALVQEAGPRQQLISLRSFAELYEQVGNYPAAQNFYQQAITQARRLEDTKEEAQLRSRLTQIVYRKNRR